MAIYSEIIHSRLRVQKAHLDEVLKALRGHLDIYCTSEPDNAGWVTLVPDDEQGYDGETFNGLLPVVHFLEYGGYVVLRTTDDNTIIGWFIDAPSLGITAHDAVLSFPTCAELTEACQDTRL